MNLRLWTKIVTWTVNLFFFPFVIVTIARAIELKHNATLIAALAFETANFYQKAGKALISDNNHI